VEQLQSTAGNTPAFYSGLPTPNQLHATCSTWNNSADDGRGWPPEMLMRLVITFDLTLRSPTRFGYLSHGNSRETLDVTYIEANGLKTCFSLRFNPFDLFLNHSFTNITLNRYL